MDDDRKPAVGDRFEQVSAWALVGLGSFLLLNGLVGVARAATAGDWPAVVVYGVLMLILAAGVTRGVRQLGRLRRRSRPSDPPPGPADPQ